MRLNAMTSFAVESLVWTYTAGDIPLPSDLWDPTSVSRTARQRAAPRAAGKFLGPHLLTSMGPRGGAGEALPHAGLGELRHLHATASLLDVSRPREPAGCQRPLLYF